MEASISFCRAIRSSQRPGERVLRRLRPVSWGLARDFPFMKPPTGAASLGGQFHLAFLAEVDRLTGAAAGFDPERLGVAFEGGVKRGDGVFHRGLHSFPNHVDLGVVGDRLERDVRHAPINEPHPDIAASLSWFSGRSG